MSLYAKPSPLRDALTGYKSGTVSATHEAQKLFSTIGPVLRTSLGKLKDAWGEYDCICIPPSSQGRLDRHPLLDLAERLPFDAPIQDLLKRRLPATKYRYPNDQTFEAAGNFSQRRVLIFDDAFVTGSTVQSAASTLTGAGLRVTGILVIARRINPTYNQDAEALWDRQAKSDYVAETAFDWLLDHEALKTSPR